ncbi:MAG TPA: hypothetical protein VMW16_02485 [Sedimentisphaerales bacterium]|nr:hypothetical protein [Sedimentisphaerales bacterium]
MRVKRMVSVAIIACLVLFAVASDGATEKQPDYLRIVKSYADALLEHGRDTYGTVQSPLIASALDRKSLSLIEEKLGRIEGIRNGDRSLYGANPMHDQDLYQTLYALTQVTGDKKYAQQADKALKWFFENCQSPATGLMAWGEHIGWGFKTETLAYARGDNHEFFGAWVLWDKSFELAPQACIRFGQGLWDHQIHEHSGEFSRHASWTKHATGTQNEYPRHGGFYIAAWARAYEAGKDPVFLKAIETLIDYFEKNSSPKTGAIPCSTNPSRLEIMWPESNLSLAVDLWDGAKRVPDDLARKMRQRALKTDKVYLSLAHDFSPAGKGFVAGANVHSLECLTEGPWTDTAIWATGYGKATDAQIAMLCYLRYQQVKMDGYRKLVLDSASRYLYTEPDTKITLYPGSMAESVFHMLAAYELTGQNYYLDRADYFARQAVKIFLDDTSPLPKASSTHNHYETITGGDDLMASLLKLWVAQNQPDKKIQLVYNHR